MSFASPAYLAGLLLLPIVVFVYLRAERRPHGFAPAKLMPSVAPRRAGWRRHVAITGYGVALAALLVALAKPQATMAVPTEQARVMILTDRSGSMRKTDVKPSRLGAAERAVRTFLGAVPDDLRVGAIAFNQNAEVLQSPTTDRDAVREATGTIKASGTTAIGNAISVALTELRGTAPAAIVLLSDGKSTRGSDPIAAARQAKARNVPIYTVALGAARGSAAPPGAQTLAQIAHVTGGRAFTAADTTALQQVYKRLGSQIATEKRPLEVTSLFAGGALAVMTLSALGSLALVGRVL